MESSERSMEKMEELFKQYQPSMCSMAYNMVLDKEAAKDIVQEVFVKLWERRDAVQWGPALKGYLFKATAHLSLNYLERGKRSLRVNEELRKHFNESADIDSESVVVKELQIKVREAIEALPPKCKAIYLLSRHEELSYKEIAAHLNLSVKTVENQMGIALEKLRAMLKPYLTREFLEVSIIAVILYMLGLFI